MNKANRLDRVVSLLADCMSPREIEKVFQNELVEPKYGNGLTRRDEHGIWRACKRRTYEIAPMLRRGNLLPRRVDKGTGCSARYEMAGETYRTGRWGNGAGYRYCIAGFEEWAIARFRRSGLRSERKMRNMLDWVLGGYPWRALKMLAG